MASFVPRGLLVMFALAVCAAPALVPSPSPRQPDPAVVATEPAREAERRQPPKARRGPEKARPTRAPAVATSPRRLAEQLTRVERDVRDPAVTGERLRRAGHLQQRIYQRLADRPRLREVVMRRLPADVRGAARLNLDAQLEFADLQGDPPESLPSWRIVEPKTQRKLLRYYRKAERRYGVRWQYLAAIHLVETRMGRIKGDSVAGAQGPMQFIPATWEAYGKGDVTDDHDAIQAAARYLRARGAPHDMDSALYSYNNDVRYVRGVAAYADVMLEDPRAYRGYHGWQVYYAQPGGAVWLRPGYDGRD